MDNKGHEMSRGKRISILLACYLVVVVFIVAFILINKTNWFVLAAPFQPIAFLLAGLVAAPLVLTLLWERITSIKVGDFEIGLSDVEKKVSDTPLNNLTANEFSSKSPEALELIKTTLRSVEGTKILRISLGNGETWTVAYLYLLVALLADFTGTQQLLFTTGLDDNDIQLLGLVTPLILRRSLAKQYPQLERTYLGIYRSILSDVIGIRRQGNTQQDSTEFIVDGIIGNFLSELFAQEEWRSEERIPGLRERISGSWLKRLLGSSLIRNTAAFPKETGRIRKEVLFSLIISNTDRELTTTPLESSVRFFVIVEGRRLIVVDVLELSIRIAENTLQPTGKK